MKTIITFIFFLIFTCSVFAQERTLEKVDTDLYKYTIAVNNKIHQIGYYKLIDGKYEKHNYWKDRLSGTTAYFQNGKLIWIKPNGKEKHTYKEIELNVLKSKVARLEQKLLTLN